ncbi:hypothetical protein DIPPA_22372 [Diplonema papillatum]|nr:hypothetical protein DIPPA_22372 [Diplonema papillatum]
MVVGGAKGAREPPGFFKDCAAAQEGVTVPPRVAVRVTNSQFGARRSVELVATENVRHRKPQHVRGPLGLQPLRGRRLTES